MEYPEKMKLTYSNIYQTSYHYPSNINYSNQQKRSHNYRNIISLKRLIFPSISEDKISQIMIDDESIKYITFNTSAQEITNIIMNNLSDFPSPFEDNDNNNKWEYKSLHNKMKNLVITEMTAGVGGNILNFAKYFKYVNAIEIDPIRYNYLCKNIKLYDYNNVNCYNNDSVKLLVEGDDIVQDIIFFDPPWGGKDYKLFYNLKLTFGDFTIEEICKVLFQRNRNKMIVIKLPNNYDFTYLNNELKDYTVSKYVLDRMAIIIIKNYLPN